jgi:DNA polymerase III epsilon subunit-like protein
MYISVDVESDGQIPHKYSMVCFGAVIVEPSLSHTFFGKTKPISEEYVPEALAISGYTREQHLTFDDPKEVMERFDKWIQENTKGRPVFISDNNGFDWQFINYYFHYFLGKNPFGWSSRRIGDLYCGYKNDMWAKWKWMRRTRHTHNPVDDAVGKLTAINNLIKY